MAPVQRVLPCMLLLRHEAWPRSSGACIGGSPGVVSVRGNARDGAGLAQGWGPTPPLRAWGCLPHCGGPGRGSTPRWGGPQAHPSSCGRHVGVPPPPRRPRKGLNAVVGWSPCATGRAPPAPLRWGAAPRFPPPLPPGVPRPTPGPFPVFPFWVGGWLLGGRWWWWWGCRWWWWGSSVVCRPSPVGLEPA